MDLKLFNSKTPLGEYRNDVWRVVESQEHVATLEIVDSLDEQYLLEVMLDNAKPEYRHGTERMHYLLKTAFRYPPLKYGSRFGSQLMPSYFYGSELFQTALCETAYYRFLFLEHMETAYTAPIRSEYSMFKVTVAAQQCLDLTSAVFESAQAQLIDPQSYLYSQNVGKWAIEHEPAVDLIRFYSARQAQAINLAVATPTAIRSRQPSELRSWLCLTRSNVDEPLNSSVSFRSMESQKIYQFSRAQFCDEAGRFLHVA